MITTALKHYVADRFVENILDGFISTFGYTKLTIWERAVGEWIGVSLNGNDALMCKIIDISPDDLQLRILHKTPYGKVVFTVEGDEVTFTEGSMEAYYHCIT